MASLQGVRPFFHSHVVQLLGIDGETFSGAAEPFDMAISDFTRENGCSKLLWYSVKEKHIMAAQEARIENEDAMSNAHSVTMSIASTTVSTCSYSRDDESRESHSTTSSVAAQQRIIVSTDKLHSLVHYNCVYFIRDPKDTAVITEDNVASRVFCGLLRTGTLTSDAHILAYLVDLLDNVFVPTVKDRTVFGELTCIPGVSPLKIQEVAQFMQKTDYFRNQVSRVCDGLKLTITLAKPTRRFGIDFNQKAFNKAAVKREVVECYEVTVSQWMRQIEKILSQSLHDGVDSTNEFMQFGDDDGPDIELEYWKRRTTQLNHITDNLQTRANKTILGVLHVAGTRAAHVMSEWEKVEAHVTEAANEAKDNTKYLSTLEQFAEPLFSEEPRLDSIQLCIPAIINAIKMVHSIAKYYNTSERLTGLFVKITNQIIKTCRRYLERDGCIWDQPPEVTIDNLKACIELKETYLFHFKQTKGEMAANVLGPQFAFREASIFGKFDLFCGRLAKIADVMHVTRQFDRLKHANIEHIQPLCSAYRAILESLRSASNGYLEARRRDFDAVYQDYKVKVQELSTELVVFLNNSFLAVNNTTKALHLLSRFRAVVNNSHINKLLEEKHGSIFMSYGRDLEMIKAVYEKYKANPPCHRNTPPVSGAIAWARQLQRKIEEPMIAFQDTPELLRTRDAKRIINTYNKVAKTFVIYETRWYEAWEQVIHVSRAGLQATLLICDRQTGKVYVNFDLTVKQLIREVHCLIRLGFPIPAEARSVHTQRKAYLAYAEELHFMLDRYYTLIAKICPLHCGVIIPLVNKLNVAINPGLVQLTWTSLNISGYIKGVDVVLLEVEMVVARVNGILRHRIESSTLQMKHISFVCMSDDLRQPAASPPSPSIPELLAQQQKHVLETSKRISVLNCEVAAATKEIINITTSQYSDEELESISAAVTEMYTTFEHEVFQAILHAMQQSVLYLKSRITGPSHRGSAGPAAFLHSQPAIFNAELVIKLRTVEFSPNLEELQRCVNRIARSILESARGIFRWRQDGKAPQNYDVVEYQSAVLRTENAARKIEGSETQTERADDSSSDSEVDFPKSRLKSLFLRIGKNRRMTKVFLQLTGAVSSLQDQLQTFLHQFSFYDTLLRGNRADQLEAFNETPKTFDEYETQIKKYHTLEKDITSLPDTHTIGCLSIDMTKIKTYLNTEAAAWKTAFGMSLNSRVRNEMDDLTHAMEEIQAKLNRKVHDLTDVNNIMTVIAKLRLDESEIDMKLQPIVTAYDVLYRYTVKVTREEQDQVDKIGYQWNDLVAQSRTIMDQLQDVGPQFKRVLLGDVAAFQNQVRAFKHDYDTNGPMVKHIEPRLAVERLKVFQKQFVECKRKVTEYCMGEELFGLPITKYPEVNQIERELKLLNRLYDLYTEVLAKKAQFEEQPWIEVEIDKMKQIMNTYHDRVRKLSSTIRDWEGYQELREIVTELSDTIPILELLLMKCVQPRHWAQLTTVVGATLNPKHPEFRLRNVLDAKLVTIRSEVEEITTAAQKEADIELKLHRIKDEWSEKQVVLAPFKNRGLVTLRPDATSSLISKIEEAQTVLTTLLSSRFNTPFKKDIMVWISKLTTTQERLGEWLEVQHLWIYMEAVFSGSCDIGKEMPAEVKRFSNIDRQWTKIMRSAGETPNILKLCVHSDMLSNLLPHLRLYLDMCQKSLSGYLSNKRKVQPRFFFVSNPQLLEILGQACNPATIEHHLLSISNNIHKLVFNGDLIVGIVSCEGEQVNLETPVPTTRDVVEWLQLLLEESVSTLKRHAKCVIRDIALLDNTTIPHALKTFIESTPAQLCFLGLKMLWTTDTEAALSLQKVEKGILPNKIRKHKQILETLVGIVRGHLLPNQIRCCTESLITTQYHQYEILLSLQKCGKKIKSPADFEWLKQARYYWKIDKDTCQISIADVDFDYGFEYMGSVEKLVMNDLTDRLYISFTQALGMGYGGCPIGPAGTGKTESVKDLGRSFGRYVIVTNCSDQLTVTAFGNMLKGVATGGCWCAFDEINRVDVRVLSVVAAHVSCILNGRRNRQTEILFPDGTVAKLSPMSSLFATLNPSVNGYQGRVDLPENLKSLFRCVAVVVPDRHSIIRVRLASTGFTDAANLSRKFEMLYQLCEEQLSQQKQYDFGLRNAISILRRCGGKLVPLNQQSAGSSISGLHPPSTLNSKSSISLDATSEKSLLVGELRKANLSKLNGADGLLFADLLNDIFPGSKTVGFSTDSSLEQCISQEIKSLELVSSPEWENKVSQTYHQCAVRQGVCLMGDTTVGKSTIARVVANTMSTMCSAKVRFNKINPKTLSVGEIYGKYDKFSGDWTDGIFTSLWRRAVRRLDVLNWVVLDGPIDPHWAESLNTVLDDTKLLTLPNNERLGLPGNLHLLFEVGSLQNASPSTVSRLGMVFIPQRCLKWTVLLESWAQKHKQILRSHTDSITELYTKCVPQLLQTVQTECDQKLPLTDQIFVINMLRLNSGLFTDGVGKIANIHSPLARFSVFSMAWGAAASLEEPCKLRIDARLRSLKVDMPDNASIFDVFVDPVSGKYETWVTPPPSAFVCPVDDLHKGYVQTKESLQFAHVMTVAMRKMPNCPNETKNTLVVGKSGVGKTTLVLNTFKELCRSGTVLSKHLSLSSASTPVGLQHLIEGFVDKISGSNWGPPPGTVLNIFIDDLSMPAPNEYGDQPTLEFIRQIVDDGYFYTKTRLETAEKIILVCTQLISTMDHPTYERNIPERLKQHFFIMNATQPPPESLDHIFNVILQTHFASQPYNHSVVQAVKKLVTAARILWQEIKAKLIPVPGKEHYIFTLRDLSRLALGLTRSDSDSVVTVMDLALLYENEARRVFVDRLDETDVDWVTKRYALGVEQALGTVISRGLLKEENLWAHFLQEEQEVEGDVILAPPKYKRAGCYQEVALRLATILERYNEYHPKKQMKLVLFDFAVRQLLQISRGLHTKSTSLMLIGSPGSGRRNLSRLAAFTAGHTFFEIPSTNYPVHSFMENLRELHKVSAIGSPVTILASEMTLQQESFLDVINIILSNGEVPGLHQKDELELLFEDLQPYIDDDDPSHDALLKCYSERVRDNLHIVLYYSSGVSEGFTSKIRRFPSLVKCCVINIFRDWPENALVVTAAERFKTLPVPKNGLQGTSREVLAAHAAKMHTVVQNFNKTYASEQGKTVFVPPGRFLFYLDVYCEEYVKQLTEIEAKQKTTETGLATLAEAHEDISVMKRSLNDKQLILDGAANQLEILLSDIRSQADIAAKQTTEVETSRNELAAQASKIQIEKDEAAIQLAAAEPAMKAAEEALHTIKPEDIATLKRLPNPPMLIRRIMDGVLILRSLPIDNPAGWELDAVGTKVLKPSWAQGKAMALDFRFLQQLQDFPKDSVNDEHCELLAPYLAMEDFTVDRAKAVCGSLAGLCTWLRMMTIYHSFAKAIAPKRQLVSVTEAQLYKAKMLLKKSEKDLGEKQVELEDMKAKFRQALDAKTSLQQDAEAIKRRLITAETLLGGLDAERERWNIHVSNSNDTKGKLEGNVARLSAFMCYCPPFSHTYRTSLMHEVVQDLKGKHIPQSTKAEIEHLIMDGHKKRSWALTGLALDQHSTQNAVLIETSRKKIFLIDPQGQGRRWIAKRNPTACTTSVESKEWVKTVGVAAREGKPVILEGVDHDIPTILQQVVHSNVAVDVLQLGDLEVEIAPGFDIFFVSSLTNPDLHPDVFTKMTVIDFADTLSGLTDRLLSTVIRYERPALEEDRLVLIEEMLSCEIDLANCEAEILARLSLGGETRLLDDGVLIEMLSNTKERASEISERLAGCTEANAKIAAARDEYRAVAHRGAIIYLAISDMANVKPVYNVSLEQFEEQFEASILQATPNPYPPKRVANIVEHETEHLVGHMKRGYYSSDQQTFITLVSLEIQIHSNSITQNEVSCLLSHVAGPASDVSQQVTWMSLEEWSSLHILEKKVKALSTIKTSIISSEPEWQNWYKGTAPEELPLPGLEDRLTLFQKVLVVRVLRPDRTGIVLAKWCKSVLGPKAVRSAPLDFSCLTKKSSLTPVLCLLSPGVDPILPIDSLGRKSRVPLIQISMGDGQADYALRAVSAALEEGNWIVIQNVHLAPHFLTDLLALTTSLKTAPNPASSIWLTTLPSDEFSTTALQQCVKVAIEQPKGISAGLSQAFQQITQDQLESIHQKEWRVLVFTLCFFHITLIERNRFGSLGWSVPYDFSTHDLTASMSFLYNYLYTDVKRGISWTTIQYMLCDVQYGGRVTNLFDSKILSAMGENWLVEELLDGASGFTFAPNFRAPDFSTIDEYLKYINGLPSETPAQVFGLQSNAEISANLVASTRLIESLSEIRHNRESSMDYQRDRSNTVMLATRELIEKLKQTFDLASAESLKRLPVTPLTLFLRREVALIQNLISAVVLCCKRLQEIVSSGSVLSDEFQNIFTQLSMGKVPSEWVKISWGGSGFGFWTESLLSRVAQLQTWMLKGAPKCFWLPGFLNPKALVSVLKQEYIRPHAPAWTLDSVGIRVDVTKHSGEGHFSSEEGVYYLSGLYLVAGTWDRAACQLVDPPHKNIYNPLPVLRLLCMNATPPDVKCFMCPLFRDTRKTHENFIFNITMRSEQASDTWVLRGTAAICNIDTH